MATVTHSRIVLRALDTLVENTNCDSSFCMVRDDLTDQIADLGTEYEQLALLHEVLAMSRVSDLVNWSSLFKKTPFVEVCAFILGLEEAVVDGFDVSELLKEALPAFKQRLLHAHNVTAASDNRYKTPRTPEKKQKKKEEVSTTAQATPRAKAAATTTTTVDAVQQQQQPPLEFVLWESTSANNGDLYQCWLQWTGNEEKLRQLDEWVNEQNDPDAHQLYLNHRITEAEAETLDRLGTCEEKNVYVSMCRGNLRVRSSTEKNGGGVTHYHFDLDDLYLDNIETLFQLPTDSGPTKQKGLLLTLKSGHQQQMMQPSPSSSRSSAAKSTAQPPPTTTPTASYLLARQGPIVLRHRTPTTTAAATPTTSSSSALASTTATIATPEEAAAARSPAAAGTGHKKRKQTATHVDEATKVAAPELMHDDVAPSSLRKQTTGHSVVEVVEEKASSPPLMFVLWESTSERTGDVYRCWLQWTGNEEKLRQLAKWLDTEEMDEEPSKLLLDRKLTEAEAKELAKGREAWGDKYAHVSMHTGVFNVPSTIPASPPLDGSGYPNEYDFDSIADDLYCDIIEKRFRCTPLRHSVQIHKKPKI